MEGLEEKTGRKRQRIFEEIMTENSSNLKKNMKLTSMKFNECQLRSIHKTQTETYYNETLKKNRKSRK